MIDFNFGISLRTIEDHLDGELLFKWRNDYRIWKTCRQNDLLTRGHHANWMSGIQNNPHVKMYAICLSFGKELIGACGLTDIDMTNRRAEFSLYIEPEYQKNGYATAALKTLFHHGFQNLNLNCIWGETFDGNPAVKMFEKIGMEKEGTRKQFYFRAGKYIDAHLYSVLASEWPYKEQV